MCWRKDESGARPRAAAAPSGCLLYRFGVSRMRARCDGSAERKDDATSNTKRVRKGANGRIYSVQQTEIKRKNEHAAKKKVYGDNGGGGREKKGRRAGEAGTRQEQTRTAPVSSKRGGKNMRTPSCGDIEPRSSNRKKKLRTEDRVSSNEGDRSATATPAASSGTKAGREGRRHGVHGVTRVRGGGWVGELPRTRLELTASRVGKKVTNAKNERPWTRHTAVFSFQLHQGD